MNGIPEDAKAKPEHWVHKWAAWPAAIVAVISLFAGLPVATYYVGRGVGSNEYILNLPADLKATKEALEKKIEEAQERNNKTFAAQVGFNEKIAAQLDGLRQDVKVNTAMDDGQRETVRDGFSRLEKAIDNLRLSIKH